MIFTDTHAHISLIAEELGAEALGSLLRVYAEADAMAVVEGRQCPIILDPGVEPKDLPARLELVGGNSPPFLRILSWNTLADGLAQLGRFSRCPEGALAWPSRRRLVLREIERSRADIACLQEVNRPGDLESPLREAGYDGAFWAKPVSPAARLG